MTAYLYHGWMHRPSSIPKRWQAGLITSDIISGVVLAAMIIISFLSLMSFADFLRVHWAGGGDQQQQAGANRRHRNNQRGGGGAAADEHQTNDEATEQQNAIDNNLVDESIYKLVLAQSHGRSNDDSEGDDDDDSSFMYDSSDNTDDDDDDDDSSDDGDNNNDVADEHAEQEAPLNDPHEEIRRAMREAFAQPLHPPMFGGIPRPPGMDNHDEDDDDDDTDSDDDMPELEFANDADELNNNNNININNNPVVAGGGGGGNRNNRFQQPPQNDVIDQQNNNFDPNDFMFQDDQAVRFHSALSAYENLLFKIKFLTISFPFILNSTLPRIWRSMLHWTSFWVCVDRSLR